MTLDLTRTLNIRTGIIMHRTISAQNMIRCEFEYNNMKSNMT